MKFKILFSFILSIALLGSVSAQNIELNGKNITIHQNDIVIEVRGLVCSFCAIGLQGGLSSLQHIDKNKYKNGVFVDVEHQYAVIAEIEGEDIDIEQAVAMITGSGYEVTTVFTNRTSDKIEEWKIKGKKDER